MFIKIAGAIIIITLLVGGYFFWQSTQGKSETTKEESTSVSETPTETPTPDEVKKDEFSIKILNGSGIAGEAGRAQKLLEDADFKVDSTGNADNYDYEETIIQAGEDVNEAWIDAVKKELEKKYTVKSKVEKLDGAKDVTVIVGVFDKDGEKMEVKEETTTSDTSDKSESSDEAETDETPTPSPTP